MKPQYPQSLLRRALSTSHPPTNPTPTPTPTSTPTIPGYRLPPPAPTRHSPLPAPPTSTPLPLSPLLESPTDFLPYSKRNPKHRPLPGPNHPPTPQAALLKLNPYARILASPARNAVPFQLRLPQFLLVRLGVLRRPQPQPQARATTKGEELTYLLPTNLLPETKDRQVTMQGIHVACRKLVFGDLGRKGKWKRLIPEEGSRGMGDVRWRADMPVFVERGIRRRAVYELQRMMGVLPRGAVGELGEDGKVVLVGKHGERAEGEVGCILVWGKTEAEGLDGDGVGTDAPEQRGDNQDRRGPPRPGQFTGDLRTLPSGKIVPVHDMDAMFPDSDGTVALNSNQIREEVLGLGKDVTEAAVVVHHQTVQAQMWLMKLRYYLS